MLQQNNSDVIEPDTMGSTIGNILITFNRTFHILKLTLYDKLYNAEYMFFFYSPSSVNDEVLPTSVKNELFFINGYNKKNKI